MSSAFIQTGTVEPIEIIVLDMFNERLESKTDIYCKIRRQSDDLFFDWDDNYFRTTPVTPRYPLVEITDAPGEYKLDKAGHVNGFNTASVQNLVYNDIYMVTIEQVGGTDAANLPQLGEVRVGHYVDDIPGFTSVERTEIMKVLGITGTGTPVLPTEGAIMMILGLVQHNFVMDDTDYNMSGLMTQGRIRIFPDKDTAEAATDGGIGEGELASFQVSAEAEASPHASLPVMYKMVRTA